MPSNDHRKRTAVVVLGVLAVVTLLYSMLVTRTIVLWLFGWSWIGITAGLLYLLWRLVRAAERIADSLAATERGRDRRDSTATTERGRDRRDSMAEAERGRDERDRPGE